MSKKSLIISILLVTMIGVLSATSSSVPLFDFLSNTPEVDTTMTQEVVEEMVGQWKKDGSVYTTTLEYETPAGIDTNPVSVTVEDGKLTAFSMSTEETKSGASKSYQDDFVVAIEETYIGTDISELKEVDVIAGASLTTQAFVDALSQI